MSRLDEDLNNLLESLFLRDPKKITRATYYFYIELVSPPVTLQLMSDEVRITRARETITANGDFSSAFDKVAESYNRWNKAKIIDILKERANRVL